MQPYCSKSATRCVIDWGFEMTEHPLPSGDGPYADHPVLAPLSRVVRQSIADQIAHNRNIGAIKTLRDALGGSNIGLKEAKDVIDGLVELGDPTRPGSSSAPVKVVSRENRQGGDDSHPLPRRDVHDDGNDFHQQSRPPCRFLR